MRMTSSTGRIRSLPRVLMPALLALLLVFAPQRGAAEDEDPAGGGGNGAPAAAPKPPARPTRPSLLPGALENPKLYKDLVEAARRYFDLEEELWTGRKGLLQVLTAMADEGKYPLKDMEFLRWLLAQSRSFEPALTDRKWQRDHDITEAKALGGTLYSIKSEELTLTFSVPRKAWKHKDLRNKFPRPPPYPLLLSIHEKRDFTNKKYPGQALLQRRYPKRTWGELYEQWMALVPVAAAGNFIQDDMVRAEVLKHPYSVFWKHYHVDFERVVLDGADQAFTIAAAMPVFFAGIVFRGDWKLETDEQKSLVRNFAPVPVYVVDNPDLAKQLRAAGHPNVTAGIAGPILLKWMGERKRFHPLSFRWTARVFDQVLPYWINLDATNWSAPERTLEVEVVDTEEDPNTVRITAEGIQRLSLFLNDDIVDLDRPVRVLINGNLDHDKVLEPTVDAFKKIGRDLDLLFNKEPVRIRNSMFFGWLKSARIVQLQVRPPAKKEEPVTPKDVTPESPPASPEEEVQAERYWSKVLRFEQQGQLDQVIKYLNKIIELPRNKRTEAAKTKLALLEK